MRIGIIFIGWNISDTIALTVKHYKSLYGVDQIIYLDNYSTDESPDYAKFLDCEVRQFGIPGVLDDQEYIKIKNHFWKGMDYDYVIICDSDEILFHPDFARIVEKEKARGTTIFKTQGYGMYSENVPRETWLEIKTGQPDNKYSKLVIFDPKAITDINFVYGCHQANPTGNLVWSETTLPLLHYMAVGGAERMIQRHQLYASRLSGFNRRWNCGIEYTFSPESKREWFKEQLEKSSPLLSVFGS